MCGEVLPNNRPDILAQSTSNQTNHVVLSSPSAITDNSDISLSRLDLSTFSTMTSSDSLLWMSIIQSMLGQK